MTTSDNKHTMSNSNRCDRLFNGSWWTQTRAHTHNTQTKKRKHENSWRCCATGIHVTVMASSNIFHSQELLVHCLGGFDVCIWTKHDIAHKHTTFWLPIVVYRIIFAKKSIVNVYTEAGAIVWALRMAGKSHVRFSILARSHQYLWISRSLSKNFNQLRLASRILSHCFTNILLRTTATSRICYWFFSEHHEMLNYFLFLLKYISWMLVMLLGWLGNNYYECIIA